MEETIIQSIKDNAFDITERIILDDNMINPEDIDLVYLFDDKSYGVDGVNNIDKDFSQRKQIGVPI